MDRASESPTSQQQVPFTEAVKVWARVAALSFGGPAGQIAVMHRILVEEKRWIGDARFLQALNYCMLLPGPEAQQLATYIGWLMHRTRGGIVAGGLFILPGMVAIMALSWVYALFGQVPAITALFFGLKAAVLAVVLQALIRIGHRALGNRVLMAIAAAAFILIFFMAAPFPVIVLGAGVIGYLGGKAGRPEFQAGGGAEASASHVADADTVLGEAAPAHATPRLGRTLRTAALWLALWLIPPALVVALLGPQSVFSGIAQVFTTMAVVTFGGAYAVLAYVAQQAVQAHHWLSAGEMMDGLGMAETTPGPLIMVLQFVGFMGAYHHPGGVPPLVAGTLGGLLATWVTFTPCFLWIFVGAPFIERLRGDRALAGALRAITAAVVGVILNLTVWFALHTVFRTTARLHFWPLNFDAPVLASLNPWALLLSLAAILAMLRFKLGMIATLAASSAAGVGLYLLGTI